jgi:pSer/pThr/pTyr-binding forkhead associated (FHA) protein
VSHERWRSHSGGPAQAPTTRSLVGQASEKAMYKYNCRKCPIRNRCIDQSANAPTIKEVIRHSFHARTDTVETWGLLQPGCLLLQAEEERAKIAPRESMLSRRLRQAREAREEATKALSRSAGKQPDYLKPVSPAFPATGSTAQDSFSGTLGTRDTQTGPIASAREHIAPRWLILLSSERRIALPADRGLVLGRFDPNFGIPPDIDLSFEDRQTGTVSRRHAKISGLYGRHLIEDLGSRHGLFINGERLEPGPTRQLDLGDRIALGNIELLYESVPAHLLELPLVGDVRHFLTITPTGRKVRISPPKDIVIGRSDRLASFRPDVDLGHEKQIAVRVSRRHAIITWREGIPYVEDLGSGFGTRLNGRTLLLGQADPLRPGDHIWLGGCILAYDVDM